MMSVAKTIKDAEERYFLLYGEYLLNGEGALFDNLDISFPKCEPWQNEGIANCKNFFINIWTANPNNGEERKMVMIGNYPSISTKNTLGYALYFDKSSVPGRRECWASADDTTADNFCKSVGTFQTQHTNFTSIKSPFNVYLMD
jgi:hypothetical protein